MSLIVIAWDVVNNWLALTKGDKVAPICTFFKLDKASAFNLRDLNLSNVCLECLKFKLDPALVNMLYSGFKSIYSLFLL